MDRERHRGWGQPRYGYRVVAGTEGNALQPDPHEQTVVSLIRRLRGQRLSWRQIVTELVSRGIPPRHGGQWHPITVSRIHSYGNDPYEGSTPQNRPLRRTR